MMQILSDVTEDDGSRRLTVRNYDKGDADTFPDLVRRMAGIPHGWSCEVLDSQGVSEYVDLVMRYSPSADQADTGAPLRRAPDQEG